jgi:hypothetical protein
VVVVLIIIILLINNSSNGKNNDNNNNNNNNSDKCDKSSFNARLGLVWIEFHHFSMIDTFNLMI